MQHFYELSDVKLHQASYVVIGVFDGVHLGHQHLLSHVVQRAHQHGGLAVVLTFFPHPDQVVREQTGRYYITTPAHKAELLNDLGVDVIITHPFDDTVRHIRAATFIEMLLARVPMQELWVTADFALGYQREGNYAYLQQLGRTQGFEVHQMELFATSDQHIISSSHIRQALLQGEVELASQWLGRPYRLDGVVIHGDKRGRTIGFPTANLSVWDEQILPAHGVYACWFHIADEPAEQLYMAVTNIGTRPTFNGTDLRIEVHVLDFDRDIYDQAVTLFFVEHLRGEKRFNSLDELILQIRLDIQQVRATL